MSIAGYPVVEALQTKRDKLAALLQAKLSQPKICPLSFAQQRLWFLHQMAPDSSAYNLPYAVRLMGELDVDVLQRSIDEIVRRHEILRTTFYSSNDKVRQKIAATAKADMQFVDLTTVMKGEQEEVARQLIQRAAIRAFNLSSGRLMRVILLKFANNDHVLLVTMHHIVSDGWSVAVMMREFCALYGAYHLGQPSPLQELPIQYADYAVWQREWLTESVLRRHLEYWRDQLAGAPVLEIPTDYPRSSFSHHRASRIQVSLSQELTGRLNELSRCEGATLFMTTLAAFQLLLSKYTEQRDIAVGSVIANRNRPEIEGLIGFFVNTLVLRTNAGGNPTFRELLARVRGMTLGAYAYQDLPFEKLVEELEPERSLAQAPLFQAMLVMQNTPQRDLELQDIQVQRIQTDVGEAKFELTLSLHQSADGLKGELEYAADLFEAGTMQRLVRHYQYLLETVATKPEVPVSEFSLVGEEEQRVIAEWNRTEREYPRNTCVHQLFEQQAEWTPDAIALVYEGRRLTYCELNHQANQLAHYLRKLGVGPDVRVGVCFERSLEMVTALLAVLKAGAAYLPLDPDYPQQRLLYMLDDAQAPVLLSAARIEKKLPNLKTRIVYVDRAWDEIAMESGANLACVATSENLAYVIYTSGSTGNPKGVAIQHASLMNLVTWHQRTYNVEPGARATQIASPAFDASAWELWPYLAAGSTICIPSEETRLSSPRLLRWLASEKVTTCFLPTALAESIVDSALPSDLTLTHLLTGGDQLRFAPRQTVPFSFINHYGPTENTVVTTFSPVVGANNNRPPTIGRPIENTQVCLLNSDHQLVPIGFAGEIHIGGESLARGYLSRPELTAEKFIPNPFSNHAGARLYRTGDLARYLPDGNIEFLGRIDGQVKIRGLRIELGEIEAVLAQHPGVETCAALAREDKPGEKQLVAYIVAPTRDHTFARELREDLRDKLPSFMVPSRYVMMDQLPVTSNGKLDRKALPAPTDSLLDSAFVAPHTRTEKLLVDIWRDLLDVAQVGVEDNFFELGGHSLLATQLVSRLRSVLELELSVRDVFESPTPARLAQRVESASARAHGQIPFQRLSIPRGQELPLSFAQQRLWFLDQLEPDSPLYSVPAAIRVEGTLNVDALERSLHAVVQRHEVLRTVFTVREGKPLQVVLEQSNLIFEQVDLREWGEGEAGAEAEARRRMVGEARRPFQLSRGPLLRALLLRLSERVYVLLLNLHHIVSDGWSLGVLIREMGLLYEAMVEGRASPLAELQYQYVDFAHWQRQWLQGEALEKQLQYWKQQLEGSPTVLELPTDRPRPAVQSFAGGTEMFELPGELSEKVKELSQRRGLTLFMTLLGAYQVLLGRYSGEMDVLVGSPIANRNRSELEGLIGLFVNTLVLRTEMKDNPRVGEMLKRVQEAALEGYAHQDVPFEKLVEELHPQRQMSHSPLFQVMFVLQNAPLPRVKLKGLTTTPVPLDSGTAKFDLTIYLMGGERGLQGWLEYNTDLFEATTIKRMVGHYERLLEGMVRDVEQKIQEIPLLTTGEREQLLVEWNGTEAEYPREKCLQELFEEQVERTPGAVALVCEGYQLTYEQLNARANQLARYLRKLGVRREVCAGLLMERSLEMVVACLGVLKAGGAYVALDPESPVERLAYMLEDSKPVVLLTQEQISRRLSANPVRPVLIDRDWPEIAKQSEANVLAQTTADNLAYVIYTSGSTGKPKGVLGLHNGIVNRLSWMGRNYPFHSDETCCQKTAFSFVDSIAEIFEPLLHGICTVILPNAIVKDPLRLVAELAKNGISRIVLVPSLLRAMLDSHRALQDHLPRLKLWVLSGEALPLDLAARFQEAMPGATLLNLYGSTEVSADATAYEMRAEASRYCVPIGRPIDNMQVFILDGNLVPVPVGIPGEVFVTGAGIARGYLNAPELTAEKFVPNPFGFLAGTRLYKTGDVARSLLDGNIEFLGRSDLQIKIRGFRIEEAEISTALRYHPAVRDVVLATVGDGSTEKQLVAYLVCEAGPRPAIGELRRFLSDKLPGYMIPSHFVMINVFPLLPNGKIDKNGLPSAVLYHNASENPYVPPATETEQTIAAIWRKLLKLEQVGIRDNFFDLGGHSLLMVQVQRELQTLLGKELSVVELFEYPTIKSLSEHLSNGASMHVTALDVQERMDKQKRVLSRKKRQAKPSNEVHE